MALDLKSRGLATHITGVDANPEHARKALALGLADEILPLEKALESDLVIVSVPVSETVRLLPIILDLCGPQTAVMDVGSTKGLIEKSVRRHPKRAHFAGTHPIAGTEYSGPTAAMQGLFDNKVCILNVKETALWAAETITSVYETLNMRMLYMDADSHDRHVAYVSHISHISSFALASTVLEIEKNTSTIFDLAGSGFASTVRLAKSSPDMWAPVFEQNEKHVIRALDTYIRHLKKYRTNIKSKRTKTLKQMIVNANAIRKIIK